MIYKAAVFGIIANVIMLLSPGVHIINAVAIVVIILSASYIYRHERKGEP